MSSPPSPSTPPATGLPWLDVLLSCLVIAGPALGWLAKSRAASSSERVQLERTLLDASRLLVEGSQKRHSADGALISELDGEVQRQRQMIRELQQWRESIIHWAARENLTLPTLGALEGRYKGET